MDVYRPLGFAGTFVAPAAHEGMTLRQGAQLEWTMITHLPVFGEHADAFRFFFDDLRANPIRNTRAIKKNCYAMSAMLVAFLHPYRYMYPWLVGGLLRAINFLLVTEVGEIMDVAPWALGFKNLLHDHEESVATLLHYLHVHCPVGFDPSEDIPDQAVAGIQSKVQAFLLALLNRPSLKNVSQALALIDEGARSEAGFPMPTDRYIDSIVPFDLLELEVRWCLYFKDTHLKMHFTRNEDPAYPEATTLKGIASCIVAFPPELMREQLEMIETMSGEFVRLEQLLLEGVYFHRCGFCNRDFVQAKCKGRACAGCSLRAYCDAACQKADWTYHRHLCGYVKAMKKEEDDKKQTSEEEAS